MSESENAQERDLQIHAKAQEIKAYQVTTDKKRKQVAVPLSTSTPSKRRTMKLKIQTGHELTNNVKPVNSDRVRFVAEDGRTMFEVKTNDDGTSIDVRSVDTCRINGVLYDGTLELAPRCANVVTIRSPKYSG
jgi:hypothetical protein